MRIGGAAALLLATTMLVTACSGGSAPPAGGPGGGDGSASDVNPTSVQAAVGVLDGIVGDDLRATGVPGAAVAVVYRGQVVYAKGFGVRQVGRPEPVDTGTVFQLASVSKAIAGTVVGAAVDQRRAAWTDTVASRLPGFTLSDPWVGSHATVADMLAHRSGLPEQAGDRLEDLGYSQDEILFRLRFLPLAPFRDSYGYANYGLTAGGEAVARAAGTTWPDLAQQEIFSPLGMTQTSYRFADLAARPDRAALHVQGPNGWVPDLTFDVDRQAPAGGASSSVDDLTKWMTMLLAGGRSGGRTLLSDDALRQIWGPQSVREPAESVGGPVGFYGEGWNVDRDSSDRLVVQHSGAFAHGAATNVLLIPAEQLGIVTLTNGYPVGLPEAINKRFVDQVENGRQTQDWLTLYRQAFAHLTDSPDPTDYTAPAPNPTPAQPAAAYVGRYRSDYWGDLVVAPVPDGSLAITIGPDPVPYPLTHYTGDRFVFRPRGESAFGPSGLVFTPTTATVTAWDDPPGVGVFGRVG